ncbi:YfjL-like protein [Sutcliffiella cohnii]
MKRFIRIFLITTSIIGISFIVFGYTLFNGLPWKKHTVASELEAYVEEKYDIEVKVKEKTYNFKDGNYGIIASLQNQPNITFSAEKLSSRKDVIFDYYPEAIWVEEINSELAPILNENYPKDFIFIDAVYGSGQEMNMKKQIVSYKVVPHPFFVHINVDEPISEEHIKNYYEIVKFLQERKISNIELSMGFSTEEMKDSSQKPTFTTIRIEAHNINSIQKKEDVYNFIETY